MAGGGHIERNVDPSGSSEGEVRSIRGQITTSIHQRRCGGRCGCRHWLRIVIRLGSVLIRLVASPEWSSVVRPTRCDASTDPVCQRYRSGCLEGRLAGGISKRRLNDERDPARSLKQSELIEKRPARVPRNRCCLTLAHGRCHPAHGLVARAKADPMKVGGEQIREREVAVCCYRPLISPDREWGKSVSHSKEWRGRRDSNPRPLP